MNPHISIIVAMAKNRVIGVNGGIPWHLPNELKMFKRLTMGHHIVMGRKTYDSIGRLLPGRTTVIVTRQPDYAVPGAIIAHSLVDAVNAAARDPEIFVIGGAEIFRDALPLATRLHLTIVDAEPVGDTFMPVFDEGWKETVAEAFVADERHAHAYRYSLLERTLTTHN
jgi:dihydrofolate reductase